ncbi:MAG: class I SAM-dependent methyltransferase [Methanotrichaceae archaeon]
MTNQLKHVDTNLDAWDKDYRSRGRLWGSATKDLPDLPEGSAVLELGCGDGKTLSAMTDRGWRITALDISAEALRLSRIAAPDAFLLLADARSLPFRDESFDAVFAFHVTGHLLLDDRESAASEALRVLRKGGNLFLREFGAEDMRSGKGEEVELRTFRRGGGVITHYFTEEEIAELFSVLEPLSVQSHGWKMRIDGKHMVRSEIEAIFKKAI